MKSNVVLVDTGLRATEVDHRKKVRSIKLAEYVNKGRDYQKERRERNALHQTRST